MSCFSFFARIIGLAQFLVYWNYISHEFLRQPSRNSGMTVKPVQQFNVNNIFSLGLTPLLWCDWINICKGTAAKQKSWCHGSFSEVFRNFKIISAKSRQQHLQHVKKIGNGRSQRLEGNPCGSGYNPLWAIRVCSVGLDRLQGK